jgi:hypothetical protein
MFACLGSKKRKKRTKADGAKIEKGGGSPIGRGWRGRTGKISSQRRGAALESDLGRGGMDDLKRAHGRASTERDEGEGNPGAEMH